MSTIRHWTSEIVGLGYSPSFCSCWADGSMSIPGPITLAKSGVERRAEWTSCESTFVPNGARDGPGATEERRGDLEVVGRG